MTVLVTGADGFVGSYLKEALERAGEDVVATSRTAIEGTHRLDLRDRDSVEKVVSEALPRSVFHLAAQSSVGRSWRDPQLTYSVNITGTHYLLDALRKHAPNCRVLIPCTSDEYGFVEEEECPINESRPLRPLSPYAVSKVGQESLAKMFFRGFGLQTVVTRAFMHIGPRQPRSFATADWAAQIAAWELRPAESGVVSVGNIDLIREFGDVRDVVRAYRLVLERGVPGEVYNVATGEGRKLREALAILMNSSEVELDVSISASKIRPADPPRLVGDARKLRQVTGWKPEHDMEATLLQVLDYWRRAVREDASLSEQIVVPYDASDSRAADSRT